MIISHQHRFAFVHIPKCAGTSVRLLLQEFDSLEGQFTNRVSKHPVIGELDYVHIPLFALRDYFAAEFDAVRDYWSFSVIRDPFSRFASSVSQRLRMYGDGAIQKRSLREIQECIDQCISFLSSHDKSRRLLPPEFIHFQRQIDYIELGGKQIVDALYTVGEVDRLLQDIEQRIGQVVVSRAGSSRATRTNQTIVFRNDLLRRLVANTRPLTSKLGRIMSESAKEKIRDCVYVPRDKKFKKFFTSDFVHSFVREYYVRDIQLYNEVDHCKGGKML